MTHHLVEEARALLPSVVELRRNIHREPELGLDLPLTQAKVLAALDGLDAEVKNDPGYPVTVNDTDFARFVLDTGKEVLGSEQCVEQPSPQMPGEDFSYVLEQIPGAMASLGTRPEGYAEGQAPNAHSNRYQLNEGAMASGIAMYAGVALAYLSA